MFAKIWMTLTLLAEKGDVSAFCQPPTTRVKPDESHRVPIQTDGRCEIRRPRNAALTGDGAGATENNR
jgi:hypothetical protein